MLQKTMKKGQAKEGEEEAENKFKPSQGAREDSLEIYISSLAILKNLPEEQIIKGYKKLIGSDGKESDVPLSDRYWVKRCLALDEIA